MKNISKIKVNQLNNYLMITEHFEDSHQNISKTTVGNKYEKTNETISTSFSITLYHPQRASAGII